MRTPQRYGNTWVTCALLFALLSVVSALVFSLDDPALPPGYWSDIALLLLAGLAAGSVHYVRPYRLPIVVAAFLFWLLAVFTSLGIPENTGAPMLALLAAVVILPSMRHNGAALIAVTTLLLAFLFIAHPVAATYGYRLENTQLIIRLVQIGPAVAIVGVAIVFANRERALATEQARNRDLETTITNLSTANIMFQQYAQEVEVQSKDDERKRITRDLHDSIGYMISVFTVMLDAAIGFLPGQPERCAQVLHKAREHADNTHQETRRALHALRSLEEATAFGVKNIFRIADSFGKATGVAVDVQLANSRPSYGAIIDATLYRFVQEALVNAFRHGKARHIQVSFWVGEGSVTVFARDDGTGSAGLEEGIGFLGMRERLSQVDGELTYESLETGFRVAARIPLKG